MTMTENYGLVVGGYRVTITNWNGNGHETFFQTKFDATEYLARYKAFGYEGNVEAIYLHVKEGK
jgi:hypothetical protein